MARYRKIPIEVEAVQWQPGMEHPGFTPVCENAGWLATTDGPTCVFPGSWIVSDLGSGSVSVCRPDEFARMYEVVITPAEG